MNRYPLWKNILIVVVIVFGALYALPNLYGEVPGIQVSPLRAATVDQQTLTRVADALKQSGIHYTALTLEDHNLALRFADTESQLQAQDHLADLLGENYVVALHLVPAAPAWLGAFNAEPMYLGLDLRGGVYFLMEVDMKAALAQADERYVSDLRALLRDKKIRYLSIARAATGGVDIRFRSREDRDKGHAAVADEYRGLLLEDVSGDDVQLLKARLSEKEARETKKFALQQNIITLRNRVNELGVAEPVIQQQGDARIVVQLPGVQDPARAKEILGATATLEFRMVDTTGDVQAATEGRVPIGSRLYHERGGRPILLNKRVIVTGDQIIDAQSGIDQQSGSPNVSVTLDAKGARKMLQNTKENIGKPMAVVYIENKPQTKMVDGKPVRTTRTVEEVINVATIRDQFSKRFQITGLDGTEEARTLALLLRAGALAAPIEIVEERTVGPSLGQDNIEQGLNSVIIGFVVVLIFMIVWYRVFGIFADLALGLNLVLIVAVLSMLQATLTLPGIAGIVLTVGMAVDANVLIFERIREELRNGNSPQASIDAGYSRALATIADSNITTLIAAIVLLAFGTGPVKGFAVTLSIGIVTSMFTAILGTRAMVNLAFGARRLKSLPV